MSSEQNTQAEHATHTETYERLRQSTAEAELHEFARRPLPDRADQAAFSRATALLEAVAGNQHTPLEDRVFLEAELHEFARRPLPDRADQAAFSRATALLEAVAGNQHTPLEDRVFLAQTMPFPNVLVKLSTDEAVDVRRAVAANADAKNWLVGRLTKDGDAGVRRCRSRTCSSNCRRTKRWTCGAPWRRTPTRRTGSWGA